MVKLGWFLVPKVRSYRVSVDYDDIDEMVNRELDYDDSLSLNSGDYLTLKRTSFS